jgi:hypothetical protein
MTDIVVDVVPADAGVFQRRTQDPGWREEWSPPTRGCSQDELLRAGPEGVVPADAGVFRL